jgi:hypothetical protein
MALPSHEQNASSVIDRVRAGSGSARASAALIVYSACSEGYLLAG